MEFFTDFAGYVADNLGDLVGLGLDHIMVVAVSIAIATVIGVLLGVMAHRNQRAREAALGVTSTFLTLPSFALFGILIAPFGLGFTPTVIALVMYALLPITRNTITGLEEVDAAVVESAKGMGMDRRRRLLRIELPLAWPVIITGIRVATLLLVGIAAIAAIINGPGLGGPIYRGLARLGGAGALHQILSAVVGVIIVALLFDLLYTLLYRFTTPRGTR